MAGQIGHRELVGAIGRTCAVSGPQRAPAARQGRKRDRVELELVLELTRSRLLVCGFGASSYPSSRSFEIEFDEAAGLRVRVFTEFLWKS